MVWRFLDWQASLDTFSNWNSYGMLQSIQSVLQKWLHYFSLQKIATHTYGVDGAINSHGLEALLQQQSMATCTTHSWSPNFLSFWKGNSERAELYNNLFLQSQGQKIEFSVVFPWLRMGGNEHKNRPFSSRAKVKSIGLHVKKDIRSIKMIHTMYEWIQLEIIMNSCSI